MLLNLSVVWEQHLLLCPNCSQHLPTPLMSFEDMSCTGILNCWIDLLVAMQLAIVALHLAVLQCAATIASLVSSTARNYAH